MCCSHLLHPDAVLHSIKCLSELKARCCSVGSLEAEVLICHPVFRYPCKSINLTVPYLPSAAEEPAGWRRLEAGFISLTTVTVSSQAIGMLSARQGLRKLETWIRSLLICNGVHTNIININLSTSLRAEKESSSVTVTVYEVWPDELLIRRSSTVDMTDGLWHMALYLEHLPLWTEPS